MTGGLRNPLARVHAYVALLCCEAGTAANTDTDATYSTCDELSQTFANTNIVIHSYACTTPTWHFAVPPAGSPMRKPPVSLRPRVARNMKSSRPVRMRSGCFHRK